MLKKMSIVEASEFFGVSKEAIHNRIRRGSLDVEMKDGIKTVLVDTDIKTSARARKTSVTQQIVVPDDRYYKLLEEQNAQLQAKVEKLEGETRSLRDQKESMLIQEREKIELIYKEKDEQLKNILTSISSQFMLNMPSLPSKEEEDLVDVEIEPQKKKKKQKDKIISLKKYLKQKKVSQKKAKKISLRFKKRAKEDKRVVVIGKKYYLNITKFNYTDLLK